MSDHTPAPAGDAIQWQEATSKNSKAFQFGSEKARNATDTVTTSSDYEAVDVNWTVGSSGNPSEDVQNKTGIRWYSLSRIDEFIFKYQLEITTSRKYHYLFRDDEPDEYSLNCNVTGNHSLKYNSSRPTIIKILYK
jgi:hypothetical protein